MKSLTVKFKDALGNPLANGRCFLKLSQDAVALSDSQIAPSLISIQLDANGAATKNIYFGDELSPANTTYTITALEAGGGLVYGPETFSITGASFNLNTAQPTTLNVMLANPVVQNPTAAQTITGFNLIISGAQLLLADGTAALPGLGFAAETGTGINRLTANQLGFSLTGASKMVFDTSGLRLSNTIPVGWSSNTNPFGNPNDTAFSRIAAGQVALGNGTQADSTGLLKLGNLRLAQGTVGAPPYSFFSDTGTGFWQSSAGNIEFATGGVSYILWGVNIARHASSEIVGWSSNADATVAMSDVNLSRQAAGVVQIGTGETANASGTLKVAAINSASLVGASAGNTVTLINNQSAAGAITGNSGVQNIFSFSISGNTMRAGTGVKITFFINHSVGGAAVIYAISYGGTATALATSSVTGEISGTFIIMNNAGSTAAQQLLIQPATNGTAIIGATSRTAYTKDSTVSQTVALTFNVANTDQIIPGSFIVELIQ